MTDWMGEPQRVTILAITAMATLCAGFGLRMLPQWIGASALAADHWFWKAYVETYQRTRRFPPELPRYLLDQHQWYPPVFPLLLSRIPVALLSRRGRLTAALVDLLRMAFLLSTATLLTQGNPRAVVIAGLTYATAPILVAYNHQVNPRGLGALLLDGLVVVAAWYSLGGPPWTWMFAVFLAAIVLLTHKMTAQLMAFLCLMAALLTLDWRPLALIPLSALVALLLSRGFYWNVARAHWDIVAFWHRNWRWLQADPVRESPVYGDARYETPTKFHRRGLPGILQHLRYLIAYLPSGWMLVALTDGRRLGHPSVEVYVVAWLLLILGFALATVFIPALKCLGSGYYYLYNAAFPTALAWGLAVDDAAVGWLVWPGLIAALFGNLAGLVAYYRRGLSGGQADTDLDVAIGHLRSACRGVVMCLPPNLYDVIAYKTGQPVLFGGHGYGFRRLQPTFPRLQISIPDAVKQYGVHYLIADRKYLTPPLLADLPARPLYDGTSYVVFVLSPDLAQ